MGSASFSLAVLLLACIISEVYAWTETKDKAKSTTEDSCCWHSRWLIRLLNYMHDYEGQFPPGWKVRYVIAVYDINNRVDLTWTQWVTSNKCSNQWKPRLSFVSNVCCVSPRVMQNRSNDSAVKHILTCKSIYHSRRHEQSLHGTAWHLTSHFFTFSGFISLELIIFVRHGGMCSCMSSSSISGLVEGFTHTWLWKPFERKVKFLPCYAHCSSTLSLIVDQWWLRCRGS